MYYRRLFSHYQGRGGSCDRPSGLESLNTSDKHFLYARDGNMDCFIIVVDCIYEFGTIFYPHFIDGEMEA